MERLIHAIGIMDSIPITTEKDLVEYVENLKADDLEELCLNAIFLGSNDRLCLYTPAGNVMKLSNGTEILDAPNPRIKVTESIDVIFSPEYLIELQTRRKNPYDEVNVFIKQKYEYKSFGMLMDEGMCEETAIKILNILKELEK